MRRLVPIVIALLMLGPGMHVGVAQPGATPAPLDENTLHALSILAYPAGDAPQVTAVATLGMSIGLPPGGAVALVLGVYDYEVCGIGIRCFVPAPVVARWSLMPAEGAQVDPATGLLTIDPDTAGGSRFTVVAKLQGGRHEVATEVHVVTPATNPFAGYWSEEAQFTCGGGAEVLPELAMEEMVFAADGTFAVTWTPFESYVDYWGTYTFDLTEGTLDLVVTGGNDVPPDFDGEGRFAFDASGRLLLTELWLGVPRSLGTPSHCGHRLVRLA